MGIYKKSTAQSSNMLMAVMQTKGPLILAISHTHKQK